MYRYIYSYPRYLAKKEAQARERRWKIFFWLVFTYFFGLYVHYFFEMNKAGAVSQVFKLLVYALVPTTLSWLLVRYWRYVLFAILILFLGWVLVLAVGQLWRFAAA